MDLMAISVVTQSSFIHVHVYTNKKTNKRTWSLTSIMFNRKEYKTKIRF